MKRKSYIVKRVFDYILSFIMLVCSSPFLLIAIATVKICSPEDDIFFKQRRIGLNGREFIIYKLRSMTSERDKNGELLPDEERLKTWGKIIRKSNIDEIPQIANVLLNDMSLIGPRPLLKKEMEVMSDEEQRIRQSVLPGITGWEAVNEAKAKTRREKALLDLYYVEHWSLILDIKIFFMTAYIVFFNKRPDDSVRAPKIEKEKVLK